MNRLDDVIVFHSLSEEDLLVIVDIQLQTLSKRLEQQKLTLQLTDAAKRMLGKEGFDPQFGARPLKRAIQEHILDPMAMRLLDGGIQSGAKIHIDAKDSQLVWNAS